MKIAVQLGFTELTANAGEVAHETEIRGFDGLFFPEHTHVPASDSAFPYPGSEDRLAQHMRYHSPLIALAWAASTTKTLTLGTAVGLPAQHDAIALAKALASLDAMSGGRIVYGFGFGWSAAELANHGVDPKRRRAVAREKMLAMKALWTQEEASFSGEFVRFASSQSWPKPKHLPILLGAGGDDKVLDQVIEYCDGWLPPADDDLDAFKAQVDRLRSRAEAAGRDPATIAIDVITRLHTVERFEALQAMGVRRVILPLPFVGIDEIRRTLDGHVRDFVSVFH